MKFGKISFPIIPTASGLIASTVLVVFAPVHFYQTSRIDPAIEAFEALREGGPQALEASINGFRAGLQRDPASPFRWCDLGEAYLASGDLARAQYCFTRGLALGPKTPSIQFRAASFHLRAGEFPTALTLMAGLLGHQHAYDEIAFSYYDRLSMSIPDILRSGIPAEKRTANAWLQHLLETRTAASTTPVWQWIAGHSLADDRQAGEYVGLLLKQRQYAAAAQCWSVYMANRQPRPQTPNLLLNGGFEDPPSGIAFDWQIHSSDQAQAARDCGIANSGKCSLRVQFDAKENLAYDGVSETVIVAPGVYRLEARIRTNGITTDQGVRLHIFDSTNPERLNLLTNSIAGTVDWTTVRQIFTVPADTHAIVIQLARSRSEKFENQIKGTVWLDDVSLSPATI
jgi:tetratricopeptide (TPR) repeat protein